MVNCRVFRAARLLLGVFPGVFFLATAAFAQNGSIRGVVTDARSGETLIGASVVLEGTTTGVTTDLDGRYEIPRLASGAYSLAYSYIGYRAQIVRNVQVTSGAATKIDVSLAPEAVGLGEVIVEAKALRDTEGALLRERQMSAAVSDAVSAEAIGRSGSSTAADAVRKVTGASVVGGRYVYVRGLGDRYANTQLNGATLPSADPDRNAVPLDLFPASLLDNIVTTKTFTPDKPGSFTGGSVNIATRAFPERFTISFSASAGYNANTSLQQGFLSYNGRRSPEIPAAWADTDNPPVDQGSAILARRNPELAARLDALARSFEPVMAPGAVTAPINRSYSFAVGNQVSLFDRPLGFLGSFSYDRDFGGYSGGTNAAYILGATGAQALSEEQNLADVRSTDDVLWGGLATLSYKPSARHAVGITVLYNRSATSESRFLQGRNPRNFPGETREIQDRVLAFTKRQVYSVQISGESSLSRLGNTRVDWSASRLGTTQDEPDLRFFINDFTVTDNGAGADTSYNIATSNYRRPSRYFRGLEETGWEGSTNVSVPFSAFGSGNLFKFGGAVSTRDRSAWERRFEYYSDDVSYAGSPDAFFSQVGVIDTTVRNGRTEFVLGNYILDASSLQNNYAGEQTIAAGYGMFELRPLARLRLISGVRYEHTAMNVLNQDTAKNYDAHLHAGTWLPSVNLVYELGRMNLRAAYGRTLARPTFRELSPAITFAFASEPTFKGNPELDLTLVNNFDLRWEWFVRPGEILAVSGFYKRFRKPIERTILNDNFETTLRNVDDANVYGLELEARKRLDGLMHVLRNVEVGGNLSLTQSVVDIPAEDLVLIRAFDPDAPTTRALQGQSPYVINADVTYATERVSTSLLYNLFGRRISEVSVGATPSIYELPFHSLDITLRYAFPWGAEMKAAARNLLDQDVRRAYPYAGRHFYAERYAPGRSFSLGAAYRLP